MTKWKLVPTYPSKEMIIDGDNKLRHCAFADDGPAGAFVRHPDGGILSVAAYKAMLEAAQQPPKLSDERLFHYAAEIRKALEPDPVGATLNIVALLRAIEREILGGQVE